MKINAEFFWLPKAGCSETDYEDAFYPRELVQPAQRSFRCAVADGATDSSFSGLWARLLVEAFVKTCDEPSDLERILAEIQPLWECQVGQRSLPWYAEEKVQAGAFSSLLGLTLSERVDAGCCEWQALAVGDACLVQVRDEQVIVKFPIEHSSRFNTMPFLVASNPSYNAKLRENLVSRHGGIQPDDTFYLMTDALACWFMTADEQGCAPWRALRNLTTTSQRESFAELVDSLRARRELKNDDCTLIRIDIQEITV